MAQLSEQAFRLASVLMFVAACDHTDEDEREWRSPTAQPVPMIVQSGASTGGWTLQQAEGVLYAARKQGGYVYRVNLGDAATLPAVAAPSGYVLEDLLAAKTNAVALWSAADGKRKVERVCPGAEAGVVDPSNALGGPTHVELAVDRGTPAVISYPLGDADASASVVLVSCSNGLPDGGSLGATRYYANGDDDAGLLLFRNTTSDELARTLSTAEPPGAAPLEFQGERVVPLPNVYPAVPTQAEPDDRVRPVLRGPGPLRELDGGLSMDAGEPTQGPADGSVDAAARGPTRTWTVRAVAPDRSAAVVSSDSDVRVIFANRKGNVRLDTDANEFAISRSCGRALDQDPLDHTVVAYARDLATFEYFTGDKAASSLQALSAIKRVELDGCTEPVILVHDFSYSLLAPATQAVALAPEGTNLNVLNVKYASDRVWIALADPMNDGHALVRVETTADDAGVLTSRSIPLGGMPLAGTLGLYDDGVFLLLAGRDGNLAVITQLDDQATPVPALDIGSRCERGSLPVDLDGGVSLDAWVKWVESC